MLTSSGPLSVGSVSQKVGGIPLINLNHLGILMTLSIMLATGATNGEFPYWKLGDILSFLPMPAIVAEATVLHLIALSALYK
jgi:TM2 domain-containing membrane protein YozV